MIDANILMHAISLALLFVLFATGAYKRSYTTTIYIVAVSSATELYSLCDPVWAHIVILSGAIIALLCAVINKSRDKFIKRGGGQCGTVY